VEEFLGAFCVTILHELIESKFVHSSRVTFSATFSQKWTTFTCFEQAQLQAAFNTTRQWQVAGQGAGNRSIGDYHMNNPLCAVW
jgi:hypothetical protein